MVLLLRHAFGWNSPDNTDVLWGMLTTASLVCGTAVGTAADRYISVSAGLRAAMLFSCGCIAFGAGVLWLNPAENVLILCVALIVGLGIHGDWSSLSEAARLSVPSAKRWLRMRWFYSAFPLGILAGCLTGNSVFMISAVGLAAAGLAVGVLTLPFESLPSAVSGDVPLRDTSAETEPVTDSEECDATECCGGAAKDFVPTSFFHGILIAAAGHCALWTSVIPVLALSHGHVVNAALISAGLVTGHLLVFSAAPRAGYIVLVLPFLVLSIPAVIVAGSVHSNSGLFVVSAFLSGFLPGGVVCGMSAISGELFQNCPTDPKRTRVISTSLFGTTVVLLLFAIVAYQISLSASVAMSAIVYTVGICVIRAVPGPVISTLGKEEETDAATDSELQEIVAAITE